MKSRKVNLALAMLLVLVLVMASAVSFGAPKEKVVKIITSTGSLAKALPEQIKAFNELHKGEYRIEAEAESLNSLLPKLMTQFITKVPTYDIIPVDGKWSRRLEKYLYPLEPFFKKDKINANEIFGEKALAGRRNNKKQLTSLPVSSSAFIFFYRTDLLKEAGITKLPQTLPEYLEAARKLTKRSANGGVEVYGIGGFRAMGTADAAPALAYFLQARGARVLNSKKNDASPDLKKPVTLEVLEFMNTVVKEGLCPNPLSWDQYSDRQAFSQGKLAMSVIFSPIAGVMEDPKQSKVVGKVGYAILKCDPAGSEKPAAYSSGWGLGIDKNSPNKEAAWEFIKFITANEKIQKEMAMSGKNDPAVLSVLNDPEYAAKIKSVGPVREIMTSYGMDMPQDVEQGTEIEMIIHEELQLMWSGRKAPKEVANALYDRIHKLMTGK